MADNSMKKSPLAGVGKVYRFTIKQVCSAKGWLISTILIAVLLLVGIPLILMIAASPSDKQDTDETRICNVVVCDETEGDADYSILKQADEYYKEVNYTTVHTMDDATKAVTDKDKTVVLRVQKQKENYALTAFLPEQSQLSRSKVSKYADFAVKNFRAVLMQKANLTPETVIMFNMPVLTDVAELKLDAAADEVEPSPMETVMKILLPVALLMIVYLMVILYGQSMANNVMLEKNSKLIETILTAVHPFALLFGKLLATATAAILQVIIWIGALIGGLFGGAYFVKGMFADQAEGGTVQVVSEILDHTEIFSIPGLFLAILVLALGFLLYLSLGAVAGSLATKAEDLSKTNIVFVLVLLVSFFLCMGGNGQEQLLSSDAWLKYFPFTALMVNPSEMILGHTPMLTALISIVIMIISVVLLVALAAAIYKMLLFYRGQIPTPKKLLSMRNDNKTTHKE